MNVSIQEILDDFAQLVGQPAVPPPVAAPTVAAAPTPAGAPAVPPVPAAPPVPPAPLQVMDYAAKGYHVSVTVSPNQVVPAAELLDRNGFSLDAVSGVDWIAEGQIEVVYDYFHPQNPWRIAVRTRVPRDNGEVPTLCAVFAGANWHERETAEFFGIRFTGHPNLIPLLLPEDATYHPLRKDFSA